MKKSRFPSTYVIVFALVVLCAVATWIFPGGEYAVGESGLPEYSVVDNAPQTWQVFSALYNGFVKQAGIIVFILVVGGAFWLLNATGAVDWGIRRFIGVAGRYDKFVLGGIALLFSAGGAIFGMSEEVIPFVGIVVPLVISMGYDAITGLLIVYVASNIGFSSAFLNPFTVGIAQEMSGLPMFSGMEYRLVCWVFLTALTIAFILAYASRIKTAPVTVAPTRPNDAAASEDATAKTGTLQGDQATAAAQTTTLQATDTAAQTTTLRKKLVLSVLLLTVVMLVVGVTCFKWYIEEISALFLAMGIVCGVIAGFPANKIADEFIAGAKDIFSAALIVGLASGIVIILQDGKIMDAILHSLESSMSNDSGVLSLTLMYLLLTVINLFIPSATAKAAIAVPILAPFSDMIGLSRQSMVLAFQFGDGFTNMITPTSGVLIAALAMAKIPYAKWVRFALKYILILLFLGFCLLLPTVMFGLKGF